MAASDSTPSPIKGQQFEMPFVFIDNTTGKGITGATGIVTKIMKDDGSATTTTNTTTETALGFYRIVFTATEMNSDRIDFVATCTNTNAQDTFASIATQSAGKILVNMQGILATTLTEASSGQLTGGFKKWFDVATPVGTVNSIPNATAGAAGGLFIAGTNAATTVTTSFTTTFTGNLTGSVATVSGSVGSVSGNVSGSVASVVGSVGSVTGNIGGSLSGNIGGISGVTIPSTIASPTNITAGTITTVSGNVNGSVAGNVTGSVGSISGVTFPTNFGDLAITVTTGRVTVGAFLSTLDFTATMKTSLNAATPSVPSAATIAAATRDVNNTSPAANSLGAAVNNASAPTVVEIDTQLSNTHGSGQWGSSSGSGAFLVTVTVTDNTAALVPNANVRVSNNTEGTFVSQTNSSGVASFSLNAAVFDITITKPQTQFTPATITVTTSANFPETIQLVAIPAPPAGGLISNVFGSFEGLSSTTSTGIIITFTLSVPKAKSGPIIITDPIVARIVNGALLGPSGQAYVPLYRNDGITPEATTYSVNCPAIGFNNVTMTLSAPTFDLASLIS